MYEDLMSEKKELITVKLVSISISNSSIHYTPKFTDVCSEYLLTFP